MDIISIGVDPSLTATGIVVLFGDEVLVCKTLPNQPKLNTVQRVASIKNEIAKEITKVFAKYNKKIRCGEILVTLAMEGFSYGSKGRSIFDIGYLGWRLREQYMELQEQMDLQWIIVPPSNLKQYATGKGNANKEVVMVNIYKRWDMEVDDNNQADAFVLAKIAKSYTKMEEDALDFQVKCMDSVRKVNI